jgi:predicted metal-dependent phosphoesterase TrpH
MPRVRLDLHVHSRYSPDSSLPIGAIASRLAAAGLNGFALTDHNTVRGHAELLALRSKFPEFVFVPGVEVSTSDGHLLAYGISEAPPTPRPLAETIEWVEQHGGVAVLSHPFRISHGVGRTLAETARVVAVETVNGHNSRGKNRKAEELARRRRIGGTGGSDVHQFADLGRAYTEFPEGTNSAAAVLASLRAGTMTAGGSSFALRSRIRLAWRTTGLRWRRRFRPI